MAEKKEDLKFPVSKHLLERRTKLKALEDGTFGNSSNELSIQVFETAIEKEKTILLNDYLQIYEKAITKAELLENEREKLKVGKKTYEMGKDGEFAEKQVFDEQAVRQLSKVEGNIKNLYLAIDKAMSKGNKDNWNKLSQLVK